MTDWTRDTPWRQGLWLSADSTQALGFMSRELAEELAVVVISHDCDLAQSPESEPIVEVIVGRVVAEADGTFRPSRDAWNLTVPGSTPISRAIALRHSPSVTFCLSRISRSGPKSITRGGRPDPASRLYTNPQAQENRPITRPRS